MKQNSNRRNFIQKASLLTAGLFSVKFLSGKSNVINNTTEGSPNSTMNTIHKLHTTHGNFSKKDIPVNQIEEIKQACIRAANSSNMQTYSIIEIKDKELMKSACGYVGSCMLLFNVDYNRLIESAKSLNLSYHPGHMTSFVTGSINTAFAAQTAVIAARSFGIDALTTNGIHRGNIDKQWELLNLPEKHCMPLIAVVLGYANSKPDHNTGRLNGKEVFHDQKYALPTEEELDIITQKYDNPDEHLALNPNFKDQGHDHYLQWLFKDWSRDDKPKTEDTQLFAQLKKRGFVEGV